MKKMLYALLVVSILAIDRFTKTYALRHWQDEFVVNPFLFFQVTINRGISWGLLNYSHTSIFVAVTVAIALVTGALIWYSWLRFNHKKPIFGELCVIAGSISNIIDRMLYSGVVDFIVVHKDSWTWPVFNVADSFIVLGVGIMFMQLMTETDTADPFF